MMNNVDFLRKLNPIRQKAVLDALNRVQLNRGNPAMDWKYFNNLRRDEQHTLLEENEFFGVTYNMVYYHMLAAANKIRNNVSQKYALEFIKEIFGLGTVSNQDFPLSAEQRTKIRNKINKVWTI